MSRYSEVHARSIDDRDGFWLEAAGAVDWYQPPTVALDDASPPFYRWFPDGVLNTCHNALDRHVDGGRADQDALRYDSPVTGTSRTYTYRELRDEVARFAGVLRGLGVEKGDRVVVYMPMVPEAVVAMLACARIGAVHSVVFGGFAPNELAMRIEDAEPKVVVSASCGIEPARVVEYVPLLDRALELSSHRPGHCVVLQRDRARAELTEGQHDWHELMASAEPADCVHVQATDPLYVLYTSGTTGKPKGIVRDNGGHAVALVWSMPNVYGLEPGEVMFTGSDIGWVVGHSYIVYAPLLHGCTTVLYEGKPVGTPDAGAYWRVVQDHGVQVVFTAPTAFRAIKKEDPDGKQLAAYDVASLRYLFLAGERLDPETYHWASDLLDGVPVLDHWWQTETGWPVAANLRGLDPMPPKPGSPTVPVPGYDVRILRPDGSAAPAGEDGDIVVRLPMPPGCLPTLWNADDRYVESYLSRHPGHYLTGDGGHLDDDGYLYVMGRTDDVINVAGHRLSTGSMEEVIAAHPAVAECCVVGVHDELKGQVPRAFAVLKAGVEVDEGELSADLLRRVREEVGAIASMRRVDVVRALPKTRSGKILRKTLRGIADGRDEPVPSTIEDAGVLDELAPILRAD